MKTMKLNEIINEALQREFCEENHHDGLALEKKGSTYIVIGWTLSNDELDPCPIEMVDWEYNLGEIQEWVAQKEYECL